jgi:hypothetical protein
MENTNWFKLIIWLLAIIFLTDLAFDLIILASTIANLAGLFVIIGILWISVKTRCFTEINFKNKNKHEKSN